MIHLITSREVELKESMSFEGNQECLDTIEVGAFYLSVQKEKKQSWADMVEEDEEKANSASPMLNPIKTLSRSPVPAPRGVTDLDASDDSVAAEAFISAERERRAAEASHMKADVGVAVDSEMKNHGRAETCRHGSEDVSTAAYPGRVGSGEKSNSFMGGKPHATEDNVFKPSKAEVVTFGGIKEASAAGVRTSGRLCAQPNADATQMERAQHLAQCRNDFMSSVIRLAVHWIQLWSHLLPVDQHEQMLTGCNSLLMVARDFFFQATGWRHISRL